MGFLFAHISLWVFYCLLIFMGMLLASLPYRFFNGYFALLVLYCYLWDFTHLYEYVTGFPALCAFCYYVSIGYMTLSILLAIQTYGLMLLLLKGFYCCYLRVSIVIVGFYCDYFWIYITASEDLTTPDLCVALLYGTLVIIASILQF